MILQILIIILAVLIVASIMLQQGKGSDLGSAFGGGSSDSLFGPLGPGNFLSKATWGMVAAFFILCLAYACLLYTSPSPRDRQKSRMPSSA